MEAHRDDGRVQMRRCLEAMDASTDIEERTSLWRAASRYLRKGSERLTGLEIYSQPPPRRLGVQGWRVWEDG